MVQLPAMKRVKGRAPLSVVVAIIGGLALAGIIFTEDLRGLTEVKEKVTDKEKKRTSLRTVMRTSALLSADVAVLSVEPATATPPPAPKMAFNGTRCSVTDGYWAYDRSKKLPYTDQTCPYVDRQDSCQRNGRPDSDYLYWDWHLDDCLLPRFDPVSMLEKLRGKRIMFVGDSLQLGQWLSFVCLVNSAVPDTPGAKSMERSRTLSVYTVKEYNASIEFYWAPFLVESNSDRNIALGAGGRVLHVDAIEEHGKHWRRADILVFDSYVWWMTGYRIKSVSEDWGREGGIRCYNETWPITQRGYRGSGSDRRMMEVMSDVLGRMRTPVTLLNITQLTEHRVDAHVSVYTETGGLLVTDEEKADPQRYTDCIHWCIPGVPDTWNRLLYAHL
ncbi:probable xylan O-acetyltransferase 8 isoform X2 [Oryza glaberrima]|uniref:probable xylan O-acetyltransferase 8 isoform X2 n=1 Tax=Oryza glaberrima TaxID=4538 RepID=UPI00224C55F5|nr:probable xylan O-acetyltransferase 8 isoform X2 [Oryza glaberrima]